MWNAWPADSGTWISTSGRSLRAELLSAHLVGPALTRYALQLEPVASADRDTLIIPALRDYNHNGSTSGP